MESKLPPKVPVVVKVAPSPYQSCIYSWIKASGACTKSSRLFYWINTLVGMTHQSWIYSWIKASGAQLSTRRFRGILGLRGALPVLHLLVDQGLVCAAGVMPARLFWPRMFVGIG